MSHDLTQLYEVFQGFVQGIYDCYYQQKGKKIQCWTVNLQYLKKQEICHSCTLHQDYLFHQNVGVSSAGWCFEHTEKVKETKIWHGTIRMETICHMGTTHCVFKQKKKVPGLKNKRLKDRLFNSTCW